MKYSDQELLGWLEDIESDWLERKRSFKGDLRTKVREAVCAFANDLPNNNRSGVIFIGVEDDGAPSKEEISDELLRNLADMKTDGRITPLPALTVEKRRLQGSDMAIVTVAPSDMPPVKFDGRIWIRTGSRRAIANEQEERILIEKRRYKNIPFDIFPVPSAKITDLSRSIFENDFLPVAFAADVLEANGRTYEERLASTKMIVSPEDTTPTVLGLLTIGKNPQAFLPGAYIQFLRIGGIKLSDPVVDEERISGTFSDVLRQAEGKIKSHNRTSIDITSSATHKVDFLYPPAAVQQILYNAILHRTYENTHAPVRITWFDNRIEISSPGGPYGNVTMQNWGRPGITDYRNPNIAEVLKIFGYVQSFGRGLAVAAEQMKSNGNPVPTFEINQSMVSCTLSKKI